MHPREFEYIRHGTQSLIASFNVATGQVNQATVGDTRTEQDSMPICEPYWLNCQRPPKVHLVMDCLMDCLNTHQSQSLLRLVAELEETPMALGQKGKSGVLQSMATRAAVLSDPNHRLVVHVTPKHCSWLNPIEIWFSILVRKLLSRSSFTSTAQLKAKVLAFVD
ncbi:MAG: transposase [Kaiparowitsia implicata GSE-PSE-MK54-09C]|nr:transposase [Kaiparowitsia implicata GSE-PSE-MK54-09C]